MRLWAVRTAVATAVLGAGLEVGVSLGPASRGLDTPGKLAAALLASAGFLVVLHAAAWWLARRATSPSWRAGVAAALVAPPVVVAASGALGPGATPRRWALAVGLAAAAAWCGPLLGGILRGWKRAPPRVPLRTLAVLVGLAVPVLTWLSARPSAVGSAGASSGAVPGASPPVLLVTVDSLRADALSGEPPWPSLPAFERLASLSVDHRDAVATSPWTKPSVATILTGLPTATHGVLHRRDRLPEAAVTLAERLRAGGYRTGAIVSNPFLSPPSGLLQGFGHVDAFPRASLGGSIGAAVLRAVGPGGWHGDANTDELFERALAWLTRGGPEPPFLWLHVFDPHAPYEPAARFRPAGPPPPGMGPAFGDVAAVRSGHRTLGAEERAWVRALYAAEVREVDAALGRFLDGLETAGLLERSVIVLTSDHGEEFWEHGGFEHGHSVHGEVLEVPLLVKAPGIDAGTTVGSTASLEQVAPTILAACGLPWDDLPVGPLPREASPAGVAVVSSGLLYFEPRISLTTRDTKYVRHAVSGRELLFDRITDRGEAHPLDDLDRERLARAREALAVAVESSRRERASRGLSASRVELDAATRERLRALGYVQ